MVFRERERGGSVVADIDTGDYRKLTAEGGGGGRRMGIKQSLRKLGGDRVNVPPSPLVKDYYHSLFHNSSCIR